MERLFLWWEIARDAVVSILIRPKEDSRPARAPKQGVMGWSRGESCDGKTWERACLLYLISFLMCWFSINSFINDFSDINDFSEAAFSCSLAVEWTLCRSLKDYVKITLVSLRIHPIMTSQARTRKSGYHDHNVYWPRAPLESMRQNWLASSTR